ncbi:MAG TPA: helix-turn-helix domain-containing protein, partial [Bacillota bacterium]|nr:helix-turn-helix domain-containing protein [Bacillota bacterium]
FDLVGEAEDALTAMDLIAEVKPDLVITDIRMPEMDGLELISWLSQHYPQITVAVVSAYNDFPYVREALRLGAVDYLMKAETTQETAKAFLERIGGILSRRYSNQQRHTELINNSTRFHQLAIETFWRDVLTRASDEAEFEARARQLGIVLHGALFGLILLHVANYHERDTEAKQDLRETLEREIRENWDFSWAWNLVKIKYGDFIVVAYSTCEANSGGASLELEKLHQIAERLATNIKEKPATSASSKVDSFQSLPGSFREVSELNLLRLYYGEGRYIKADDLLQFQPEKPTNIADLKLTWERALRKAEPDAIYDFLNNVFEKLPQCLVPVEARHLTLDFVNILRQIAVENQIQWEALETGKFDLYEIIEQAESVTDWQIQLKKLVNLYIQALKANRSPGMYLAIQKALIFIQSNFTRELSQEEVAAHVGVNKSYLSRIFPEYTGERFSDYLQRLRIERAKELLRFTNDHIYEIASQVGFWNSRYFSRIFHEAVGVTPADYRRDKNAN